MNAMTEAERDVLLAFLVGGLLVGQVASWIDQLIAYWRRP